ncbi:MAG: hypothetical protein ABIF87_09910 [Pseudomonadota bacterium]|jgi:hypothetical protein
MGNRIAEIIISTVFIVPLIGSMQLMIRFFINQVNNWKSLRARGVGRIRLFAQLALIVAMVVLAVFLVVFLICSSWFPGYQIPIFWQWVGFVLFVPYWGCVFGLVYGLGTAVGIGGVSSMQILRTLFFVGSKTADRKKKE